MFIYTSECYWVKVRPKFAFLAQKNLQSNSLNSGTFLYNSGRAGDHAPFLETPGNSGRLGRSACAAMRSHMSEWNQSARSLLWRGQPNVAPSVHLEFCPGQQAYFSEKSTWMSQRACEFVMYCQCSSLSHCSFLLLLLCYCLLFFFVAMLEELGQNGNDTLLQIVGCSIIKNFAQSGAM